MFWKRKKRQTQPPASPVKWDDIVKDWEKVPISVYEFIFGQVKERYDEIISESQSITNKAFDYLKITATAISAFTVFSFNKPPDRWIVIGLGIAFLIHLFCIRKMLSPKGVILKGSPPNEIFLNYIDNKNYTEEEKPKIVYYHELLRYQDRMNTMELKKRKSPEVLQSSTISNCRHFNNGFNSNIKFYFTAPFVEVVVPFPLIIPVSFSNIFITTFIFCRLW